MTQFSTIGCEHGKELFGDPRKIIVGMLTILDQCCRDDGQHLQLNAEVQILKSIVDQFIEDQLRLNEILQEKNQTDT